MTEQLTTTNSVEGDERGMDRRKFLLRTTAVTAGAWAAPSILTIDKAFGEHNGSPHPTNCPCGDNGTQAWWVDGYMKLPQNNQTHRHGCSNDATTGDQAALGPYGSVGALETTCHCGASASVAALAFDFPNKDTVTADVLQSHAQCDCGKGTASGGSQVLGLKLNGNPIASGTAYKQDTYGNPGVAYLIVTQNEVGSFVETDLTNDNHGKTLQEFTALRLQYTDAAGNEVDLKFASSRVNCDGF